MAKATKGTDNANTERLDQSEIYSLPERIKYLREVRKFSQAELAKRASLSQATIAHIESSRKDPSVGTLRKIANALDVAIAVFFTGPSVFVFDLERMRQKYKSPKDLNDTMYRALDQVMRFGKELGM